MMNLRQVINGFCSGGMFICCSVLLFGIQRQALKRWRMRGFESTLEDSTDKSYARNLIDFFLGDLFLFLKNYDNMYDWVLRTHLERGKKDGAMLIETEVFLSETKIATIDRRNVRYILDDNFQTFVKGPILRSIFEEVFRDGIFLANHGPSSADKGETWFKQRKLASNIFTLYKFQEYIFDVVSDKTKSFINVLDSRQDHDVQSLFFKFAFDTFGVLGFGVHFDTVGNSDLSKFARAFDFIQQACFNRLFTPLWTIHRFFRLTAEEREIRSSRTILRDFVKDVLRERRAEGETDKRDMISRILRHNDFSDEFLSDLVLNLIIAGRDTTATALSWTLYEVLKNPDILDRLVSELDAGEEFTHHNLMRTADFPFLHGVIWEGLRLHPPVPMDSKYCTQTCQLPTGQWLPKGSEVEFHVYIMARDPEFWHEPDEMKPNRWIDLSLSPRKLTQEGDSRATTGSYRRKTVAPELLEPEPYALPIFQAGPRKCIGIDLAVFELKYLLGTLLKTFTFKLQNPDMVAEMQMGIVTPIKDGLPILCERRSK